MLRNDRDDAIRQVRVAYDREPEREWARLETGAQNRLELLITSYALQRHLPPLDVPRHILDAGGGPGRYAILLARWGYTVTLLDLSPRQLDLARYHIEEAGPGVSRNVTTIVEGSITDLSAFTGGQFDAVLCLGSPLSHLMDPESRKQALSELGRVARPAAPLFLTGTNRLAAYRAAVQWNIFDTVFPHVPITGRAVIEECGAPMYLFLPEEFAALLREAGLTVDRLYGCSGIGAHLQEENLLAVMDHPDHWATWKEVLLDTCDHPNVVGVSRQLLAVARYGAA